MHAELVEDETGVINLKITPDNTTESIAMAQFASAFRAIKEKSSNSYLIVGLPPAPTAASPR